MKVKRFQFGDWQVNTQSCTIWHNEEAAEIQIEPRAMDVLSALCHRAGEILSADDLLHQCWDGIAVGENQVHKAIAQLRRALRDSANHPRYIENIRKRGYRTVAPVIFSQHSLREQAEEIWSRASPYVGLDPFDATHAAVFFGRDAAIDRLRDVVTDQVAVGRAFVLVLGPSGSGKTSLVQAGLLPTLLREPRPVRVAGCTTLDLGDIGAVPLLTALGGALLDLDRDGVPLFAGHSAEGIGANLIAENGSPAQPHGSTDPSQPPETFVLFVDRLEALFSLPVAGALQRGLFLTALDRLARGGLIIVIAACRNDFYPDLAKEPVLMDGKATGGHFDLAPPKRSEIAQMIRLPAEIAGLSFGVDPASNDHLDDLLCDGAANSPDALPLLQYTLQQLYLQRSPGRELTVAAYRALDGIEGAIGQRAEAILAGLSGAPQAALSRIFSLIVAVGATDGAVRSLRAPWSALTSEDERVLVHTLVEQRLFVSLNSDKGAAFGVAHEALLRQWPRAVAWIAEHRLALRMRTQLEGLALQWTQEGRRADRLLRPGKPLEEARDLMTSGIVPLSAEVEALIVGSIRQARRADRVRLGVLLGFAAIALVAVLLGLRASRAEAVAALRLQEAEDLVDYMLGDFTEKLRPLGRLDLLDGVAQKALGYLTTDDAGRIPAASRLRQAKALQTLADVDRARGNVPAALKALTQAESLLRANLARGPADGDLLKMSGTVSFWFGQMALDQGQVDEAERRFGQYLDFAQRRMVLQADDTDAWVELSYALSSLGTVRLRKGDKDTAMANFEASIALKRRALDRHPGDPSLIAELADSLSWLANTKARTGHLEAATELYDQQRDALAALRQAEPEAPVWSYRLALADKLQAMVLEARGQPDEAMAALDRAAAEIDNSLREEPKNRLWQAERTAIRLQTARVTWALGRFADTLATVAAAQSDSDEALRAKPGDDTLLRQVAQARLLRAAVLLDKGALDDADSELTKSEEAVRSLAPGSLGPTSRKDDLGTILLANIALTRAEIARKRGNGDGAKRACVAAVDALRDIGPGSHDFRILDPWVRAALCQGRDGSAKEGIETLQSMGYRNVAYIRFLSRDGE